MSKEKSKKKIQPAEDSIFLRVLWFMMAMNCLILISLVDPSTASLSLAPIGIHLGIPLMVFYMWLSITGCYLSYQYRHEPKPWLVGLGLVMIAIVMAWFVDNLHTQFVSGMDIDVLLPTVHMVAGLWVSHSFEMRTRSDFNFSLILSLVLVFMTATLGKGLIFGALLLVYVCIAGVMLLLDCESRTFGTVCARRIDGMDFLSDAGGTSEKTGNLIVPISCMVALCLALFISVPRAESLADEFAARFFGVLRPENQRKELEGPPPTVRSVRAPLRFAERVKVKANGPKSSSNSKPPAQRGSNGSGERTNDQSKDESAEPGKGADQKSDTDSQDPSKDQQANGKAKKDDGKTSSLNPKGTGPASKDTEATKDPDNKATGKAGQNPNGKTSKGKEGDPDKKGSTGKNGASTKPDKDKVLPESLDTRSAAPQSEEVLFSVVCNRTVFFRKNLLDTFDGTKWYCSDPAAREHIPKRPGNIFWFPEHSIISVPPNIPAIRFKQQFHFEKDCTSTLPIAGAPDLIEYAAPSLWIDVCGSIHSSWELVPKTNYTAVSLLPIYNSGNLRGAPQFTPDKETEVKDALANFLQVEESLDPEVEQTAITVAGKEGNWFTKAERITDYLRKHYKYKTRDYTDSGVQDTVNHFLLKAKAGDCKDFASALVIMCRSLGIPCRFANGYSSGDFDTAGGKHVIKTKHSHAWAEIYVPRGGWVPFDATPGGTLPERSSEAEKYIATLQNQVSQAVSSATKRPSEATTATASAPAGAKPVSVLAVMLALCFPGVVGYSGLMFWRSIKNGTLFAPQHPATKIYRRFLHRVRLLGISPRPSHTAGDIQELAEIRLDALLEKGSSAEIVAELKEKLAMFVGTYEKNIFGDTKDLVHLRNLETEVERLMKKLG